MKFCKYCGKELNDTATFCSECGRSVEEESRTTANLNVAPATPVVQPVVYATPTTSSQITEADLPEKFKPLGAWSYFWLSVLYSIPIVGFIFLIIHSASADNINRRNFARSHWIPFVISAIIIAIYIFLIISGVVIVGLL